MKYLVVTGGPTASGKTAMAVELARHFKTEILSADSRQFFRELKIGVARPTEQELSAAKHHFIAHISIAQDYSVGDFERDALSVLEQIYKNHDVAILVGGSGLYLKALCEGLDTFPAVSAQAKQQVEEGFAKGGLAWLQKMAFELDPEYYAEVDQQNPARLRRAIEVCLASGRPYSSFRSGAKAGRPFTPIYLLLDMPREELYAAIDARVDRMLAQGLESEARSVAAYRDKAALKTVGYEEFFDYFDGKYTYDEAILKIKQHSRNYAKRQMTWFRKYGAWNTLSPGDIEAAIRLVESRLAENK